MNKPAKLWPHVMTTLGFCTIVLMGYAGIETLHHVPSDPDDFLGSVVATLAWLCALWFLILGTAGAIVVGGRCVVIVWRQLAERRGLHGLDDADRFG